MTYAVYTMTRRGGTDTLVKTGLKGGAVICGVNEVLTGNVKAACVVNEETGQVVSRYELEYSPAKGCWVRKFRGGKRF
jgi:hypothetical protein